MSKTETESFLCWAEDRLARAVRRGFVSLEERRGACRRGRQRKRPFSEWREKKRLSGGVRF